MSDNPVLTKDVFENVVKKLVFIEEEKNKMIDEYFPEPSKERTKFKKLMKNYVLEVDRLIKNVHVSEKTSNHFPLVIIDTEVEVQDIESHDVFKFRIVPPLQDSTGSYEASCLSPVGMSLLLKRVGDVAVINTPGGVFRYKIKSITLPFP